MSLCDHCRYGLVYERATGAVTYVCNKAGSTISVPSDIVKCSAHDDRHTPEMYQLETIAWGVTKDRVGRVKGFVPPKDD